jgi:rod shape-determining protein MreC
MILAAVLTLLVLAFFGTFFATGGGGSAAEDLVGSAVEPAVEGAHGFGASVRNFFERLFALRDVDKQYADLRTRNQILETENQLLHDALAENERLNELLGFKDQYAEFKFLPAHVIAKNPGGWFINFYLNMGADQGVKKDMTVVNEKGLIGRVVEVGRNWCKVMAIIDRQSAVSGTIQRTLDSCMVHGCGDPQSSNVTCDIYWLNITSGVGPGDKVVTTDVSGIFPKGLLIGTVTEVDQDKSKESFARITPAVDFAHIDYVLIIVGNKDIPTEDEIKTGETQTSASPSASPSVPPDEQPSARPGEAPEGGN